MPSSAEFFERWKPSLSLLAASQITCTCSLGSRRLIRFLTSCVMSNAHHPNGSMRSSAIRRLHGRKVMVPSRSVPRCAKMSAVISSARKSIIEREPFARNTSSSLRGAGLSSTKRISIEAKCSRAPAGAHSYISPIRWCRSCLALPPANFPWPSGPTPAPKPHVIGSHAAVMLRLVERFANLRSPTLAS